MFRLLLLSLAALVLTTGLALADRYSDCNQTKNIDKTIRGCTQIIERESETVKKRVAAHYNRGNAYTHKGDLDSALADHNAAIALDSSQVVKIAGTYLKRAAKLSKEGSTPDAIKLYELALKIDPYQSKANLSILRLLKPAENVDKVRRIALAGRVLVFHDSQSQTARINGSNTKLKVLMVTGFKDDNIVGTALTITPDEKGYFWGTIPAPRHAALILHSVSFSVDAKKYVTVLNAPHAVCIENLCDLLNTIVYAGTKKGSDAIGLKIGFAQRISMLKTKAEHVSSAYHISFAKNVTWKEAGFAEDEFVFPFYKQMKDGKFKEYGNQASALLEYSGRGVTNEEAKALLDTWEKNVRMLSNK